MFTDRTLGLRNARDVHALIDQIDERPELVCKLQNLARESLRQELQALAVSLLKVHRATHSPFGSFKSRALPTR